MSESDSENGTPSGARIDRENRTVDGEWPLKRLNSDVVASGPRTSEDMTREQAYEAFTRIAYGDPAPETVGAFLVANRWKSNTPTELAGFVDAMREECERAEPDADPVDCGANYDGKGDTALLGVAAGLTAAAAGTPVVVHSGDRTPTQNGDAYKHVLDALGVETDLAPAASAAMVDETGFGFYYQPRFNPLVADLREMRDQLGVRTPINTVETLANPANADVHLGSFFHLPFAKRVTNTLRESRTQSVSRVVMVQGLEGYDDVRPGYTKTAEWRGGDDIEESAIETAELGMDVEQADLEVDDVAEDSARVTEEVLTGERDGAFADAVALNAGLRIYAGGGADSVAEGTEAARDTLADGSAADALASLRDFEYEG